MAPKVCRALRNKGLFPMTKQDMLDVLRGEPKAEEAIFWWCHAWHGGVGTDLYKIQCESSYIPDRTRMWHKDPDVIRCIADKLDPAFLPLVRLDYRRVKLADVQEGQILVAGEHHTCLPNRWPCRVYRWRGSLGVECFVVHMPGVKLAPGQSAQFHPLTEDDSGYIKGFRR